MSIPTAMGASKTLATVALGIVLILVAFEIGYDAIRRLFAPSSYCCPECSHFRLQ